MGSSRVSAISAPLGSGITGIVARSVVPGYAMGARDAGLSLIVTENDTPYDAVKPGMTLVVERGTVRVAATR